MNGSENQQTPRVKIFWGILLLFLTPVLLLVKPVTKAAVLRDLLLVIWWAFILWLLVTGMKGRYANRSRIATRRANQPDLIQHLPAFRS
jgi:hypothetical protein